MIEKLLENWLDNASERSYQPVFVQMLSAQGYSIVHSTRHTALEFGKDILAVAPDGRGCAYQLKGHPGGRLSLSEFVRDIQPQLVQLLTQKIVFPGFPKGRHRSFLVTNGYFEEEVQRAVDDLNRNRYSSKVTLLSRGDLLKWATELGVSVWPSELEESRLLLELFLSDPKELLLAQQLSKLLHSILRLGETGTDRLRKAKFYRAVTSAALITGIATAHHAEAENHFAVVGAWTLFAVSVIASAEKHRYRIDKAAQQSLKLAEGAMTDALSQLWKEVSDRKHLVEGNALVDPEVYGWRYTTVLALLSCLAIMDESNPSLTEESRRRLRTWLAQQHKHIELWGEGAVAALVPWLVWTRKHDATMRPDFQIAALARTIIARNQSKTEVPLANPYYNYDQVARLKYHLDKAGEASSIGRETFAGSAFTAEPLLHLLVRTNLKQTCKNLWPDFSKLQHRTCVPDNCWDYATLEIKSGRDQTKVFPPTYNWSDLKAEAQTFANDSIPPELAKRPWLLALWWQLAPYRYTPDASRAFAETIVPGWGQ